MAGQRSITTSKPGRSRRFCGCFVHHTQLHPKRLGADPDRVLCDRTNRLGAAEYVHHIHRFRNLREIGVHFLSQKRLTREARIDGDHPIAGTLEKRS